MTKITIDPAIRAKLNGFQEEVELCDERGQTLGHFLPEELYKRMMYAYVESKCPYTKEELARMQQETGGRTLAEIWKSLGRT